MRYIGLGVLIYAFIEISRVIFVALLLISFYIKKKISKMDEEKWDLYFKSLSNLAYLIRFWILYLISIVLISIVGYYIFIAFGFDNVIPLLIITIILGIIKMIFKLKYNKNELMDKVNKIRSL